MHRRMGWIHAELTHAARRLRDDERGQGTVEYVGLVLLMAVLLGVVVAAGSKVKMDKIPQAIATKVKEAVEGVGGKGR
jgi:Flp pilus assembly pilin Flp